MRGDQLTCQWRVTRAIQASPKALTAVGIAIDWWGKPTISEKGMVEVLRKASRIFRLANALSNLYPMDREEKRFLDAMLLAMPRL